MQKAIDIMTKNVITIEEDQTVFEGAKLMNDKGVGCLVIVKNNTPVGIVTERDFVREILAKNVNPVNFKILDIYSKPLVTTEPDDLLEEVSKKMLSNNIRRIPVVKKRQLLGIITASDIARSLVGKLSDADALLTAVARYHKYGY
jgi:CBS domain-containing protein